MKTIVYAVRAAVILCVLAVGVFLGWKFSGKDSSVISSPTVSIDEIRNVARLATTDYYMSEVVRYAKEKAWYEWKTAAFLVVVKGVVTGSANLELTHIVIDERAKTVKITLEKGAIQVSQPAIGPDGISFSTLKDPNVFNPLNDQDHNKALEGALELLRNSAIANGIQKKTADRTREFFKTFLSGFGYKATVTFIDQFETPEATPRT